MSSYVIYQIFDVTTKWFPIQIKIWWLWLVDSRDSLQFKVDFEPNSRPYTDFRFIFIDREYKWGARSRSSDFQK